MHAIQFEQNGGPEVLQYTEVELPPVGPGEVRLRHTAVGVNFIDTYHRTGLYPVDLPSGLGVEGAGVVEAVGDGAPLSVGDRVAYAGGPLGAYSTHRVMPADRLVPLPEEINDATAASIMLKGLTAHYLVRRTYVVQPGDTILVYAAAGGVGLLLCQWAKHLGATVIGCVGSQEKAELACGHGCDHPILYREEDVRQRVRELTNGDGVPVVYDSVGKDTFSTSLDCLRPLGLMVTYGNASGAVPPFAVHELTQRGSLYLTRPTLASYTATREQLEANAGELFQAVTQGILKVHQGQSFPLEQAADAHRALEARETTGATLLTV